MVFLPLLGAALLSGSLVTGAPITKLAVRADNTTYDYIIVGGGTAGLVVAGRLSEDPNVNVAVIEAGGDGLGNTGISDLNQAGSQLGTENDWAFPSTPQKNLGGKAITQNRGKVLGGSSAINYAIYHRGSKAEYDAWEELGAEGWNWDSFYENYKKSETFYPPSEVLEMQGETYIRDVHGYDGPIASALEPTLLDYWPSTAFQAAEKYGLKKLEDALTGEPIGIAYIPAAYLPSNMTRSYSATGYYFPNSGRPNLKAYLFSQATKVNLDSGDDGTFTATGVELVSTKTNESSTLTGKNVILSAGSIQSPQLLELSGIGDPSILSKYGIDTKIQLPGVGGNLQEHLNFRIWFNLTTPTMSDGNWSYVIDYEPTNVVLNESDYQHLLSLIPAARESSGLSSKSFDILEKWYQDNSVQTMEVIWATETATDGTVYARFEPVLVHPFATGTTHIASSDPLAYPTFDPNYWSTEADQFYLTKTIEFIRRIAATDPFGSNTIEDRPGKNVTSYEDLKQYVIDNMRTTWHPVGTAANLPKDEGGVVDPNLKVYGTNNLFVVDGSIIPLALGTHPHHQIYAIAERFSTLQKDGNKKSQR